jgi:hypothetical protein
MPGWWLGRATRHGSVVDRLARAASPAAAEQKPRKGGVRERTWPAVRRVPN